MKLDIESLPLKVHTPRRWAEGVLSSPLLLLNDHAHLEKKAASNALDMLPRWPEVNPPRRWVNMMISIARDETAHLGTVTRILERRGGKMTRVHKNPYAQDLRGEVRLGTADKELLDRLLISSLIELRSCERFALLSMVSDDAELKKLYKSLWASEHGHYQVFLELAGGVRPKDEVEKRWEQMLTAEARIMKSQSEGPRMHSWI